MRQSGIGNSKTFTPRNPVRTFTFGTNRLTRTSVCFTSPRNGAGPPSVMENKLLQRRKAPERHLLDRVAVLHIAYVTTYDASDITQWSGLGYHISECLKGESTQIERIGPLLHCDPLY